MTAKSHFQTKNMLNFFFFRKIQITVLILDADMLEF